MIDVADIPTKDIFERDTIRLISTAYIGAPAMAPLADSETDQAFLADIEGLTSQRRGLVVPSGVDPAELLTERAGYGWTYVNAAFCHTRPTGNRFNDSERGAWYAAVGSAAVATAHAEVAFHLSRELAATGIFENITSYRELIAGFLTTLHDLTGHASEDFLNADIGIGYPAGQALSHALRRRGSNGLIYPSVRNEGGICLAAFRPHLVQNIRQGDTWVFQWDRTPEPTIEMAH